MIDCKVTRVTRCFAANWFVKFSTSLTSGLFSGPEPRCARFSKCLLSAEVNKAAQFMLQYICSNFYFISSLTVRHLKSLKLLPESQWGKKNNASNSMNA